MLRFFRESAVERPWFFRGVIILIAVTFVVSMGWFGFSRGEPFVAQIDETRITRVEYERYKGNVYRYYRDALKENFDEDLVRQLVIDNLVERKLWLKVARDLPLLVSVEELQDAVIGNIVFHDDQGRFDPDRYQFFLTRSRMMASDYEQSVREDLLIMRAKRVLQASVALTPGEIEEARKTVIDPKLPSEKRLAEESKSIQNVLVQKQQQILSSALTQVRATTKIEIKEHLL